MRGSGGRSGSSPVEERELGVEANLEARSDFQSRILEDMRTASAAPRHDRVVARPQQRRNLRAEEPKYSRRPNG